MTSIISPNKILFPISVIKQGQVTGESETVCWPAA